MPKRRYEDVGVEITNIVSVAAVKIVRAYIQLFEPVVRKLLVKMGKAHIADLLFQTEAIDQRIAKLDVARVSLIESLQAIDELKLTAEHNKRELTAALQRLSELESTKEKSQRELEEIRKIATADVSTFQKVAGISPRDRWVERAIGFLAGFVASSISALVLYPFLK
jgi:hypothetical protein